MFSLKFNALPNTDAILYWHEARSKVYKTFAEYYNIQTSEVYFEFSAPDVGWADVFVYCDGHKKHDRITQPEPCRIRKGYVYIEENQCKKDRESNCSDQLIFAQKVVRDFRVFHLIRRF